MKLFTQTFLDQLAVKGRINHERMLNGQNAIDHKPVVKLFTPDAGATWLLTETDPEVPDIAFGLCDLGLGYPELGSVLISELQSVRGGLGLPVERDLHFAADAPISVHAERANKAGGVFA